MLPNLRRIFASFRTEKEERSYSRTAFFHLIGYISFSVIFSLLVRRKSPTLSIAPSFSAL
ncbi:Ermes regulator Emr1 [Schizosaccharomyces osmophilus]|uniref:Ermes regulator Emr1 n=1 Tax=Schizosaccharomyces osmophilus TaxID=2545709 RepID=A0AAE9WDC8_9SCHI|nr:Ermes regulator Emr1 [Schizosaccharomyces osmophilus]WBW73840.1 Ermes regulator Emr1 [Schizosaccharomyces osmophilus]